MLEKKRKWVYMVIKNNFKIIKSFKEDKRNIKRISQGKMEIHEASGFFLVPC